MLKDSNFYLKRGGNSINTADKKMETKTVPPSNGKSTEKLTEKGAATLAALTKTEKPISANERILRADNFKIITDRFQVLKQRQDDLTKLLLSKDGSRETLTIKNQNGKSYEVTNSQVISDVVELLKTKGEAALKATEQEIVDFKI